MAFLGLDLGSWLLLLLGLCLAAYFYLTRSYGIWEKKGLFSFPPTVLFGNNGPVLLGKVHMSEYHDDIYKKLDGHKVAIFYEGAEPVLYVRDVELIRRVMIRDFDHFMDFGFFSEGLSAINDFGLANTLGEEWKSLKATISPAFSMRNMKAIAVGVNQVAQNVMTVLRKKNNPDEPVEMERVVMDFTMDCIARTVFSMDLNTPENPDNEFCKYGNNFLQVWRFILGMVAPGLCEWLHIPLFNPKAAKYFENVALKMLAEREKAGDKNSYNDILTLMMKARKGGSSEEIESDAPQEDGFKFTDAKKCYMTDKMISKTLMQFFIDGYDTTGAQVAICLYFLAVHQDLQERVFEEAEEVASKCGDDLSGEDANNLKYTDQFISEVGRLIAISMTYRRCTKDWPLPGHEGVIIPKGMRVLIPVYPVHRDANIFEDPETFDPDRFSPERKFSIKTGTYMPFGLGPRQCMGMKIARLEMKVFIFNLVRSFRLEPSEKTPVPLILAKDHFARVKGGNWLKLIPRM